MINTLESFSPGQEALDAAHRLRLQRRLFIGQTRNRTPPPRREQAERDTVHE